jgi:hypothetical protein
MKVREIIHMTATIAILVAGTSTVGLARPQGQLPTNVGTGFSGTLNSIDTQAPTTGQLNNSDLPPASINTNVYPPPPLPPPPGTIQCGLPDSPC